MGYLYLFMVALLFSFGGTMIKIISPFLNSSYITFLRFPVGIFFLILLKAIRREPLSKNFGLLVKSTAFWIVFGAIAKWLHYWTENYGVSQGVSYGNIITQPAQTIFLTLIGVLLFKDKLNWKKGICIVTCLAGVLLISWNGRSLQDFLGQNFLLTLLFLLSGTMAGAHVLAQKKVMEKMDIIEGNATIFLGSAIASFFVILPDMIQGGLVGVHLSWLAVVAIIIFGFITGIGFYLNAKAMPLVPFYMVPVIQSAMVIFSIIWGVLFWHESISVYIVIGTIVFVVGLVILQILNAKDKQK